MRKTPLALKRLLSYFPTPLPVGMTELNAWTDSIIELAGQVADTDSMKYVISSLLINSKPDVSSMPKNYFVRSLHKAATKQLASAVFTEIRERQQAAAKAAEQKAEDTASTTEAAPSNGKTNSFN